MEDSQFEFQELFSCLKRRCLQRCAGEIWPKASKFARHEGLDESDARATLFKAIAKVSDRKGEEIRSLNDYLFKTYTRLIRKAIDKQKRYTSLELINADISSDEKVAAIMENDILVAEIVARMDPELRSIYEALILGYSFEELARKEGKKANVLRSSFSRGIRRLAREISGRN